MQVIIPMKCLPEEYAAKGLHRMVRPPTPCPHCAKAFRLEAHGYYERSVTDSRGLILSIQVRRFECRQCGVTVSGLPGFALPYRLVNHRTVELYFNGDTERMDVQRNEERLKQYRRRFKGWAPTLAQLIGSAFGRAPPGEKAGGLWQRLLNACKTFASCTARLVGDFRTTCFGTYLCHQPRPAL